MKPRKITCVQGAQLFMQSSNLGLGLPLPVHQFPSPHSASVSETLLVSLCVLSSGGTLSRGRKSEYRMGGVRIHGLAGINSRGGVGPHF